jgi:hypothetical protein
MHPNIIDDRLNILLDVHETFCAGGDLAADDRICPIPDVPDWPAKPSTRWFTLRSSISRKPNAAHSIKKEDKASESFPVPYSAPK